MVESEYQLFIEFLKTLSGALWLISWSLITCEFFLNRGRHSLWSLAMATVITLSSVGPAFSQWASLILWIVFWGWAFKQQKNQTQKSDSKLARQVILQSVSIHSILILLFFFFFGRDFFLLQGYSVAIFQEERLALLIRSAFLLGLACYFRPTETQRPKSKKALFSYLPLITASLAFIFIFYGLWQISILHHQSQFVPEPKEIQINIFLFLQELLKTSFITLGLIYLISRKTSVISDPPSYWFPVLKRLLLFTSLILISGFLILGAQAWTLFQKGALPSIESKYTVKKEFLELLLAQEDPWFLHHHGVSWHTVDLALHRNYSSGRYRLGASSITMQLAKIVYLTPEKTIKRKIQQLWIAWFLEWSYDKESLLRYYLEAIDFGLPQKGLEYASHVYFSKTPNTLTFEESGILVRGVVNPQKLSSNTLVREAQKRSTIVIYNNYTQHIAPFLDEDLNKLSIVEKSQ